MQSFAQNNLPIEQEFMCKNNHDIQGNPTDGYIEGVGLRVNYRSEEEINTPEGCTLLDVVRAVRFRINWLQHFKPPGRPVEGLTSKCDEYSKALHHCEKLLASLRKREKRVYQERTGEIAKS